MSFRKWFKQQPIGVQSLVYCTIKIIKQTFDDDLLRRISEVKYFKQQCMTNKWLQQKIAQTKPSEDVSKEAVDFLTFAIEWLEDRDVDDFSITFWEAKRYAIEFPNQRNPYLEDLYSRAEGRK